MLNYNNISSKLITFEDRYEVFHKPRRAHTTDNGMDMPIQKTFTVKPGEHVRIPCGLGMILDEHTTAIVMPRSSTLRKTGLLVETNLIDQSYNGNEFSTQVFNLTQEPVTIEAGEFLAQVTLVTTKLFSNEQNCVDLEVSYQEDRNGGAFGSSDRK